MRTPIVYPYTPPLLQIVRDADVRALVLLHLPYQQFWEKTIVALACFSPTSICENNIILHIHCLSLTELGLDRCGICTVIRELN